MFLPCPIVLLLKLSILNCRMKLTSEQTTLSFSDVIGDQDPGDWFKQNFPPPTPPVFGKMSTVFSPDDLEQIMNAGDTWRQLQRHPLEPVTMCGINCLRKRGMLKLVIHVYPEYYWC